MDAPVVKMFYYEKTVPYSVGVRYFPGDPQGRLLTGSQPWVAVREEGLRDFKLANKKAIMDGLIRETVEPTVDWETPNTFSEAEIDDLLKNMLKLKKTLKEVTSVAIVGKMLTRAKETNKSQAMIDLLQEKMEEVDDETVTLEAIERKMNT